MGELGELEEKGGRAGFGGEDQDSIAKGENVEIDWGVCAQGEKIMGGHRSNHHFMQGADNWTMHLPVLFFLPVLSSPPESFRVIRGGARHCHEDRGKVQRPATSCGATS